MLPWKMRFFRQMFWIFLVLLAGTSGCAGDFSVEKTVLASSGLRVSPVRLRSGKTLAPGQWVLLGGRILEKIATPGGCLFVVRDLPLSGEVPGDSVTGKVSFSGGDRFLLAVPVLRVAGSSRKGEAEKKPVSVERTGRTRSSMVPGDRVTVLGEVRGWVRRGGGSGRRYLLVTGWYLDRW